MNKIITAVAAVLLATALAPAATAAPAPVQDTRLQLTVERTENGQDTVGVVWLDCPDSGRPAHPHRAEACADLEAAGGDFDRLPGRDTAVCSNEATPVTVTADGSYHGREVHWTDTYENDCTRQLATGNVFEF
ncbi:SSI family serine proteinase inhibitor [Streptomyces vietnamensis]|uniref:Subtilisin inhibitor domain-containing protein n=1 Tax=Streptomyces vietnamensis TaxID=362257 RepID=A0A0B5IPG4_9ACTN|nr:SSI family serine proteinase inhibitor [Streptomyces vietnamensis]AJF70309.1 hypothetical protein SVTN_39455 [Streptomyces vietnamensis]